MKQLFAVLSQLLELYKQLLNIAVEKKSTLLQLQDSNLKKLTQQEELILQRVGELEAQRRSLARQHFSDEPNLTLAKLIALVPESLRPQFEQLGQEFSIVSKDLKQANELNQRLIQQGLNLVNFSLNLLSQNTAGPTYAPHGDGGGYTRSIFDRKA